MFERDISGENVESVILSGSIIETYPKDKPYASYLCLGYIKERALHVVYSKDEQNLVIIITVYEPSLLKWKAGFRERIK